MTAYTFLFLFLYLMKQITLFHTFEKKISFTNAQLLAL